jgi:hypothetical protein
LKGIKTMKTTKTYRENRKPSRAAKDRVLGFIEPRPEVVVKVCAKVLAHKYPNRYSREDRPNKLALQTAREIIGKFGLWLLESKGYLVTHVNGKKMTTGHSFWSTFKRFCKFSQAARSDSQGTARRWKNAPAIDKETARKHPNRYRNTPRYHASVYGVDPVSDNLTPEMESILHGPEVAAITRRLELGDITDKMAEAEVLALIS